MGKWAAGLMTIGLLACGTGVLGILWTFFPEKTLGPVWWGEGQCPSVWRIRRMGIALLFGAAAASGLLAWALYEALAR